MANPQTQKSEAINRNGLISIILPVMLIGSFLWKVLTPAREFPMRSEQIMTISFDVLMLIGLIGLKRTVPAPLFWIALVAGIGLFALRLSADGWWTGHLVYSIGRR